MQMAELMAIQEASGFRFDMDAAERVRQSLACEAQSIEEKIRATYNYYPGKVFTPKRTSAKTGYVAGAPMTKLVDFNPTSRLHIHWALTTFRGARFTKVTDSGKPKVDEATLSEVRDQALAAGNQQLHDECEMFIRLLTLQKHMGQLSEGANSWFNLFT
jgi:DNA polymerase-1